MRLLQTAQIMVADARKSPLVIFALDVGGLDTILQGEAEGCLPTGAGPSIQQQGPIGDVLVLDRAPTFCYLMDEIIPKEFKGRVIKRMLKP